MRTSLRVLLVIGWLAASAGAAAAGYRQVAVENGGAIEGRVRLAGTIPELPEQPVYTHAETCGKTVADERLVAAEDGALANAVVYLRGIETGKAIPGEPVTIDNVRCRFVPHVSAATVGQTLAIHNSDPFLHDAHAWLGAKSLFNRALVKGATVREVLAEPGLVHINCNVRHTWMQAYVFVADDPYHAVTGADGRFRIEDVPPGTYTVTMWHELVGSKDYRVSVTGGETTTVDGELAITAPPPDPGESR
ncbi:MAG: carboxypeptidase regulatory-like domain-containing protein [Thermodesulfobacteriota bacterium]